MSRPSLRVAGLAVPVLASGTIILALAWARGDIPWFPVVSEATALMAVLIASGASAEPLVRGNRWTLFERFGLTVALSAAFTILAGLALHLTGMPVTTSNVLFILFGACVVCGVLSWPARSRFARRAFSTTRRTEITVALGSLLLLTAAIGAILVVRPAPGRPPIEVALVDDAGRLVAQPLLTQANSGLNLNVALRSESGSGSPTAVSVRGDGIRTWSTNEVKLTANWTIVAVPLSPTRSGTVRAVLDIRSDRGSARLPIQVEVAP
jgi:hypothetical protein